MRMGRRGDRYYSSEQALNKLLSIQCAFLEQRDETLNGVLHTLLLLGRGHAATITADAQRSRSPAGSEQRELRSGAARCSARPRRFMAGDARKQTAVPPRSRSVRR